MHAGARSAARHCLKAIAARMTEPADDVPAQMRSTKVDDFLARGGVGREEGRMVRDMHLAQVNTPAQSTGAWGIAVVKRSISGHQASMPPSASNCPLVRR